MNSHVIRVFVSEITFIITPKWTVFILISKTFNYLVGAASRRKILGFLKVL